MSPPSDNCRIHSASWSSRNRRLLPSFRAGRAGRRRLVAWSRTQDGETFSHSETCRTVSNGERLVFGSFGSETRWRRAIPSVWNILPLNPQVQCCAAAFDHAHWPDSRTGFCPGRGLRPKCFVHSRFPTRPEISLETAGQLFQVSEAHPGAGDQPRALDL